MSETFCLIFHNDLQKLKSRVVEMFRRRYVLYIVTAELQTANVA